MHRTIQLLEDMESKESNLLYEHVGIENDWKSFFLNGALLI